MYRNPLDMKKSIYNAKYNLTKEQIDEIENFIDSPNMNFYQKLYPDLASFNKYQLTNKRTIEDIVTIGIGAVKTTFNKSRRFSFFSSPITHKSSFLGICFAINDFSILSVFSDPQQLVQQYWSSSYSILGVQHFAP